jgi:hypothetical protein
VFLFTTSRMKTPAPMAAVSSVDTIGSSIVGKIVRSPTRVESVLASGTLLIRAVKTGSLARLCLLCPSIHV